MMYWILSALVFIGPPVTVSVLMAWLSENAGIDSALAWIVACVFGGGWGMTHDTRQASLRNWWFSRG